MNPDDTVNSVFTKCAKICQEAIDENIRCIILIKRIQFWGVLAVSGTGSVAVENSMIAGAHLVAWMELVQFAFVVLCVYRMCSAVIRQRRAFKHEWRELRDKYKSAITIEGGGA